MERPNLVWATIEYSPRILFTLEPVMKSLRTSLCYDMAHFHYFLESQFGFKNVRDSDFSYCKSLLKSEIVKLMFHITKKYSEPGFVPQLKSFDCYT